MSSDDRDSFVDAPIDAIQRHYGYLNGIKDVGEAFQLAPKVISDVDEIENRPTIFAPFDYGQVDGLFSPIYCGLTA